MVEVDTKQDYFILNNMVNIPVNGEIPLHYDSQALDLFLKKIKKKWFISR